MNFVVAINKPSRIWNGKIALDLRSTERIHAGETDAAAISEAARFTTWTGTTP